MANRNIYDVIFGAYDILCVLVTGDNFQNSGVTGRSKQKYILLLWKF